MDRGLRRHAAWLLVSVGYLIASPYYERINNPNENVRVWATRAIVEHHVQNIDEVQREWGWVNDKAKNPSHVYSGKAPGTTFLGVPVMFVQSQLRKLVGWGAPGKREATFWLRLFAVKLPMCLFFLCFARYVERVSRSEAARDLLVVALGLGTMLYAYGGMFVGHALAAAAAFSAFMLVDGVRAGNRTLRMTEAEAHAETERGETPGRAWLRLAPAGLLAGVAVCLEYQAAFVAVALAVYVGVRERARVAAFIAGALPPAVALGAYHTALFGRPWRFPYANIENPTFEAAHHAAGFHGLSLPHLAAFPSATFSPAYGLFTFSPVLLAGAVAAGVMIRRGGRRERRDGALVAAITVVMFIFLAGMSNWRAGWCVGPRYIATVVPFLLLPLAKLWPRLVTRWWLPAIVAGLVIPSVVLNVVSGALYPHYPEAFDNPVFDLAFPLIAGGHAAYGLGWVLRLPGGWSMVPLALVALAALALATEGNEPETRGWARQLGVTLAVALVFLALLGSYGRRPRPEETHASSVVREAWEPPRR